MEIVIIGNGISGITAARHIRKKSDHKITVISSESEHFFSRTALMYIYMGHMRYQETKPYEDWFWKKNRIDLLNGHVESVDIEKKELLFSNNSRLSYDKLILALGSKSNKFGWPGQDLPGVGGLYHLQDLENMERYSKDLKRAVIVGGGLIGIEMAEMFHSRHIQVTMLVREPSYWSNVLPPEESEMVTRHIRESGIDLRLGVNLSEILPGQNGAASAVIVKETEEKIECGFVGLTAGVSPNIAWLKESGIETGRGILVDEYLRTSDENVYAIGDCAQLRNPKEGRRPIEAVWYTGRMMGESVARTICDEPNLYDPGIWFNSAKFIDIEYQVYGAVQATQPEEHDSVYWEHNDGDKSIRVLFNAQSSEVVGFNLMGIRFRHKVCEKWIANKTPIEEVLKNIKLAAFDPEFYENYSENLIQSFNRRFNKNISLQSKGSLNQVLRFLQLKY